MSLVQLERPPPGDLSVFPSICPIHQFVSYLPFARHSHFRGISYFLFIFSGYSLFIIAIGQRMSSLDHAFERHVLVLGGIKFCHNP
jgi:hypothetical protein